MDSPLFFFLFGIFFTLWLEIGLLGMILFCSYPEHPSKLMRGICGILNTAKPRHWFLVLAIVGYLAAHLGPLMLGLAFLAKPRKKPNAFAKAVLQK